MGESGGVAFSGEEEVLQPTAAADEDAAPGSALPVTRVVWQCLLFLREEPHGRSRLRADVFEK